MSNMTMKDIARICGVSSKTVSRVINDSDQVKEETRDKVQKAMLEHGYEVNLLARGLKNKMTNTIIAFIDNHHDKYWGMWHTKMLSCLFVEAKKKGFKIIVSPSSGASHLDDKTDGFHLLTSKMADAAIVLDNVKDDIRFDYLHKRKIPYVLVGQVNNDDVTWVDIDNYSIGQIGCQYLVSKGYKKICILLGQKEFHVNELRSQGFEDVARKQNIEYKVIYDIDSMEAVYNKLLEIREDFKYDALYISGSERAIGAYRALKELDLKIPENVAVLGIDNLPVCEYLSPAMSVVDQNCHLFAEKIIDRLSKLISGEDLNNEKHVIIENTIVEREST